MSKNIAKWLLLTETPKFGQTTLLKLVNEFGNIEKIYSATEDELLEIKRINKNSVKDFIERREDESQIESYASRLKDLANENIRIVPLYADDYPSLLKKITNPPANLYIKGKNLDVNSLKLISIVGTRDASSTGKGKAHEYARELTENGYLIVSGLALGIDTAAHEGALAAKGGLTIAVLAHGLKENILLPRENVPLYNKICENGFACTEYSMNTMGSKFNFPQRDRIISGLCEATIVCEARTESGTIITAKNAIEQGRQLFVRSSVGTKNRRWFSSLLNMGATPVESSDEVVEYLKNKKP